MNEIYVFLKGNSIEMFSLMISILAVYWANYEKFYLPKLTVHRPKTFILCKGKNKPKQITMPLLITINTQRNSHLDSMQIELKRIKQKNNSNVLILTNWTHGSLTSSIRHNVSLNISDGYSLASHTMVFTQDFRFDSSWIGEVEIEIYLTRENNENALNKFLKRRFTKVKFQRSIIIELTQDVINNFNSENIETYSAQFDYDESNDIYKLAFIDHLPI